MNARVSTHRPFEFCGALQIRASPLLRGLQNALASHEVPSSERGWVEAKLVIWALVLAAFAGHALTASRQRRVWLSALMLVLSLTAVLIGTHLTEM